MGKFRRKKRYTRYQIQRAFVEALSKGKKSRYNPDLNPDNAFRVSPAALRSRCRRRVRILAQPKYPVGQRSDESKKFSPFSHIPLAALRARPRPWDVVSAFPKVQALNATLTGFRRTLLPKNVAALKKYLEQINEFYLKHHPPDSIAYQKIENGVSVHIKCFPQAISAKEKRFICQLSMKERKEFQRRLIMMGLPRKQPVFQPPDRGEKVDIEDIIERINIICQPRVVVEPPRIDPYKIKPSALRYEITDRLIEMARHRELPPPEPMFDFKGNEMFPSRHWDYESARKIVATQRTRELAVPKVVKKKLAEAQKENPYAVSATALKAVCSERIAFLAQPVKRH